MGEPPILRLAIAALLGIAGCSEWSPYRWPMKHGLRWSGDARLAGATDGTALGGPAVSFRAGSELREGPSGPPQGGSREGSREGLREGSSDDGWSDWLLGSWGGIELAFSALTGIATPDRPRSHLGTMATAGARPWLSRRQSRWFLRTERVSVLGVLIPETGVALGLGGGPRLRLAWDLPLGGEGFQIVPGFSWISPGGDQRLLASLSFRVPM